VNTIERKTLQLTLRPRRQLTLPAELCDALDLEVGDRLEVTLSDDGLVVRPKKAVAMRALREIQKAFATSDLSEAELQEEGRLLRQELTRARHGEG
jgi:AbrB family looped-hinge helix DNA binding protein